MNATSTDRPPTDNSLLSERIARARRATGMTQEQLADRLGLRHVTVRHWESERAAPRANRLAQLAGILNVPLLWLVGGNESPPEVTSPNTSDTARIEQKLRRAEHLLRELSELVGDIRSDVEWVQSELDAEH